MNNENNGEPSFNRFKTMKRKAISLSQESLIRTNYLNSDEKFPLIVEPAVESLDAVGWASSARVFIESELLKHGAILFRNFNIVSATQFEAFTRAIAPSLLDYQERAAPRIEVGKNIYTSTEYPADQAIPLHHEMSYSHNWPMKIWFYCDTPPAAGGATPIASDRVVFDRIDPQIKEIFMRKKVMYTRNYGDGLDIPWPDVFQTTDRSVVEAYCREAHIEFEWKDKNRLKTRQVRQAVAVHPQTGETVWFNHAHMFHISNVEATLRESLLAELTEEFLPRNAYYGDGTPIEASVLQEIRGIYNEAAISIPWQKGDVLMLDNILSSHGREPFVAPRKILVAMAELYTNQDIQETVAESARARVRLV